jgi:ATP-binding cassette subfamily B protein
MIAASFSSAATLVESALFRALMDGPARIVLAEQRLYASLAILICFGALAAADHAVMVVFQRIGRALESEVRMRFLAKVPRLGARYFRSRPTSDMVDRLHAVQRVRAVPEWLGEFARSLAGLSAVTTAIVVIEPRAASVAIVAAIVSVVAPASLASIMTDVEWRFRTHGAALLTFFLDALLGKTAVRAHGAERALRMEHERVLAEWHRAGYDLLRGAIAVETIGAVASVALVTRLLAFEAASGSGVRYASVLLTIYWSFELAAFGRRLAVSLRRKPSHEATLLRALAPLGAPDECVLSETSGQDEPVADRGVGLESDGVVVHAGGNPILKGLNLRIRPGEHVAIVGTSGAGKSSLFALLLGIYRPTMGELRVDGRPMASADFESLRKRTAWVDPAITLWNRSLLQNVVYGEKGFDADRAARAVSDAKLDGVLERLPDGMQSPLGEGGMLVSGGEGQRVRLARAITRDSVRLALLDEPFRGLDRLTRSELLARTRQRFRDATLLCITHDVGETLNFERVLVIENGRLIEDGPPRELAARSGARYADLLRSESVVRQQLWEADVWRRVRIDSGAIGAHALGGTARVSPFDEHARVGLRCPHIAKVVESRLGTEAAE